MEQDSIQMEETRRQLLSHLDRAADFAPQREQQQNRSLQHSSVIFRRTRAL